MRPAKCLSVLLLSWLVAFSCYSQYPGYGQDLFIKSDNHLRQFNYDSARHYLSVAETEFSNSKNYRLLCLAKIKQAEAAGTRELWQEIEMVLDEVGAIYQKEKLKDPQIPGLIDYNRAKVLFAQRKLTEAIDYSNKAIEVFKSLQRTPAILLSKTFILRGNTELKARQWEVGKSSIEKGMGLITDVNYANAEDYLFGKFGLGYYYYDIDMDSSFYHFKEGLERTKSYLNPNNRLMSFTYEKMGNLYKFSNEHELAHVFLQNALTIRKFHYPEVHPLISGIYNNIGLLYHRQNDFKNAIKFLNKSLDIDRQVFGNDHNMVAISLSNLGNAYKWLGQYDKALVVLEEALRIRKKLFGEYNNYYASSLNNLSLVYERIPDFDKTIFYLEKVKDIWAVTRPGDNQAKGFIEQNIASAYYNMGSYQKALHHLTVAINHKIPNFEAKDYSISPSFEQLPPSLSLNQTLHLKSTILIQKFYKEHKLEDLLLSLKTSELLLEYNEKIARAADSENSKQVYIDNVYQSFQTAIQAAYELHKQTKDDSYLEKAFNFMEKSKAFLLLENMRSQQVRSLSDIPEEIWHREDSLKLRVAQLNNEIFQEEEEQQHSNQETGKLPQLKQDRLATIMAFENLKGTIKKNHSKYFQLKYEKELISYHDLKQSVLGHDALVLEYYVGPEFTFIFGIDKNKITIFQSSAGEWLEKQISSLREMIAGKSVNIQKFNEVAHQLYDSLVRPVGEIDAFKKLVIIPDGILNYLPFEILVKHDQGDNFKDLAYLIKDHQIVYQHSTNVWHENAVKPTPAEDLDLLAFAPDFNSVQPDDQEEYQLIASRDKVRGNLTPLVGTLKELENLRDLIDGETFNGYVASEKNFKEKAGGFGIIHLATHAIVDDENPMNSRLLFTCDSLEKGEDGNLYSWELYNMPLNAQLAVLSACNTGFGKIRTGEGVMSLGRAFAYAGCPAIVMSLWPAQDEVTADIMTYFYQGLSRKLPKDQALREAKLKYLQKAEDFMAHPFYWASFVAQGDPRPISINKRLKTHWIFLTLISVISIFGIYYVIKKRNS